MYENSTHDVTDTKNKTNLNKRYKALHMQSYAVLCSLMQSYAVF